MKPRHYFMLFGVLGLLFGFIGSAIGALVAVGAPAYVAEYSTKGLVVGLVCAALLTLMVASLKVENVPDESSPEVEGMKADREKKKALSYQRFDFAVSAAQTAGAIFLIAVAYKVNTSVEHKSLIFFFFVTYPAVSLASGLLFRSWGWVGRLFVLTIFPVLGFLFGLYILLFESSKEFAWGLLALGMGFYALSDSVKRYRKVKALIEKYPISQEQP